MKTIEVDEELYRYIASHTQHIGESASDILRRMLKVAAGQQTKPVAKTDATEVELTTVYSIPRVRVVRQLLLSDDYAKQTKVVDRFMLILTTLYQLDPPGFTAATESLHGRTRTYFARDRQTLLRNGNHTKPKQVPGTHYWVITNTNTDRKRSMIEHIMQFMQFSVELTDKVCATL